MKRSADFPRLLETFFLDRLLQQRRASPYTIASYRDTFRLLLAFAQKRLQKAPSALRLEDLGAPLISAFLNYVENERGNSNSPRSRNVRLAAIRSFFRYAALQEPKHADLIQRVLAMPNKRFERRPIDFLVPEEIDALLAAPNRSTWGGRRDHALLLVAVETGLRCSELAGLRIESLVLERGAHVRCHGKGRKERCTPLRKATVAVLRGWLRERAGGPTDPLFPNARASQLSPDGVEYIVAKHVAVARRSCESLKRKRVTPHVLRHTAAMELLKAGVDRAVIALCLGHESVETTQMYLSADLELKERALARTSPRTTRPVRYRPGDRLLGFLKGL